MLVINIFLGQYDILRFIKLGYSSTAYLSNQFKKITGFSPTFFKTNHKGLRKGLDKVNS